MSVMSSLRKKLFTKGANGKKYPTVAASKARAKDFSQSEFYRQYQRRVERQRQNGSAEK